MANTKTLTYAAKGDRLVVMYLTLTYVDSATESNYVVYDSSAVATALGKTDPLDSTIMKVIAVSNVASTARVRLNWDATTPLTAYTIPNGVVEMDHDYKTIGGLANAAYGTTGCTGDITLTAAGLSTGDVITLILYVKPN